MCNSDGLVIFSYVKCCLHAPTGMLQLVYSCNSQSFVAEISFQLKCMYVLLLYLLLFIPVSEQDVIELERRYWTLRTAVPKFDLALFTSIVSPPIPAALCSGEHIIAIYGLITSSKCQFLKIQSFHIFEFLWI